jgi:hypothetical protein
MLANERGWKGVEDGLLLPRSDTMAAPLAEEVAHVEIRHDEEVESVNRPAFDGEAAAMVRGKSAVDLNSDLSRDLARVGVNADEVVAPALSR